MFPLIKKVYQYYKIKKDPINYARKMGVIVGEKCRFIGIEPGTFGSEPYLIQIGNHVTIAGKVQFITHDGGVWVFREKYPDIDVFGKIVVGDNVFIGYNSIILPGVTIGDNVVIGAGSVVTKSIPPNTVCAGVPAKVISTYEHYKEKSLDKSLNIKNKSPQIKKEILMKEFYS